MTTAVRQQADVVVRIHPVTFPRETEAGQLCNVLCWLRLITPLDAANWATAEVLYVYPQDGKANYRSSENKLEFPDWSP